jgi:hypothetical protein
MERQRAYEMTRLIHRPASTIEALLPLDDQEMEIDETLPFTSQYVQEALRCGARPYDAQAIESLDDDDNDQRMWQQHSSELAKKGDLKWQAYPTPEPEFTVAVEIVPLHQADQSAWGYLSSD